jgi:hypothetical protein
LDVFTIICDNLIDRLWHYVAKVFNIVAKLFIVAVVDVRVVLQGGVECVHENLYGVHGHAELRDVCGCLESFL